MIMFISFFEFFSYTVLDFLNFDHSTTLWSRLKSTNIQIFRLFQRLLLKFTLFQVYQSLNLSISASMDVNYRLFAMNQKVQKSSFYQKLVFLKPLYNTVLPCHTNVFLDIIVEIQAFSALHQSLNLSISSLMCVDDRLCARNQKV